MTGQNKPKVPIVEPETQEEPSTQNTSESEPVPAPPILEIIEPIPILIAKEKAPVPEPVLIIEESFVVEKEILVVEPVEEDLQVEPEVDFVFDLLDGVTILPSETETGAVMIVADKNAHKNDKKYSVLHATVSSNDTLADRFQSFWSKVFGQNGKPFKDPALFFYLSGFFTVLIITCFIVTPFFIIKAMKRCKQKKNMAIVEKEPERSEFAVHDSEHSSVQQNIE